MKTYVRDWDKVGKQDKNKMSSKVKKCLQNKQAIYDPACHFKSSRKTVLLGQVKVVILLLTNPLYKQSDNLIK